MRNIVFGPVQSRRLGKSLGVDLTPYKTCNLDCVYCECGKTTNLTNKRESYYKVEDVLAEIDSAIKTSGHVDYITLSGSGEPALYKDIKKLVGKIKKKYHDIKLAVLTNATLFTDKEVFEAFLEADVVLPSIDSALEGGFKKINRPHSDLKLSEVLNSLLRFRKTFKGAFWAEVFICTGINDTDEELAALAKYLKKLAPDKVQINTLDRPGTEKWVRPLEREDLNRVLEYFQDLPVEIISRKLLSASKDIKNVEDYGVVLSTLKRRPLTVEDIIGMTGYSDQHVKDWLKNQLKSGTVEEIKVKEGNLFYKSKANSL